ncbi:MAG: GHKL domain-containing protein [Bacteroidales bacterium]|nr:GHKL domain-containing protein [Bacteroidales bacterium]MCF8389955.1 GHKL domain-containing protein [Bacteroidales bacterium]
MKFLSGIRWYLLSSVILLFSAIIAESIFSDQVYNNSDTKRFQKIILQDEKRINDGIKDIISLIPQTSDTCCMFSVFKDEYFKLYKEEGLVYLFYRDDSLVFWTDNIISVPRVIEKYPTTDIVRFENTTFYSKSVKIEQGTIIGLFQIKTDFPYENRFLNNGFRKEYKMGDQVKIISDENSGGEAIYNAGGEFLFALDYSRTEKDDNLANGIIVLIYVLAFFSILLLLRRVISQFPEKGRNLAMIFVDIFVIAVLILTIRLRIPNLLFDFHIFDTYGFNAPSFLPSVGEFFAVVIMVFFIVYNFYIDFHFRISKTKNTDLQSTLVIGFFILFSLILFYFNSAIFRLLILNTDISFETYKVLDLSIFTFLGFVILALSFASFTLFVDKLLKIFKAEALQKKALIFLIILMAGILFSPLILKTEYVNAQASIFYAIMCLILYYSSFLRKENFQFSSLVIYILFFSLFTLYEANKYSGEKNISEMKTMAVGLSVEHDPIAELLFVDLKNGLKNDEEIMELLYGPDFEFGLLYNTIARKYFSGFWDKYDLQLTVCGEHDSVFVSPPVEAWYQCYPFFYEEVLQDGMLVPGTEEVYYLNNLNGRISYLLAISYNNGSEEEVTMFLELNSRLVLEGLGYPGLLLDESLMPEQIEYSYAKYNNNQLITSSGAFNYSTRSDLYPSDQEGFTIFEFDVYDHVAYRLDEENLIILSKPSVFWVDVLISFSYIFGFYFLSMFLLLQFSQHSPLKLSMNLNFKTKIQWGMTSVVLFSFILIGTGTVYFSINQYKAKQYEILEEKVQSVYVELIHKLEFENDLQGWSSESYFDLNELLQKFSNVFYTDINLYDKDGYLLASSRPEIFQMGLISTRMNAPAFQEMALKNRSEFVQSENIGNLNYLSVYVPFVNNENKLLAYLNLPYFTKQDVLTREITNLVVAIINIVVLLSLLSFTLAVFMANTITNPLNLLQQKFSRISLSEKNEIIHYKANDEIGKLVKEYNLMVNKLQHSVELLAISERESAWREMAKQIAHEIKNPLTPMKLNIQQLQRTIDENPDKIKEQIDRVSSTLIEQIDNLSTIATEFSSFAKMPKANSEVLDLEKKLKKSIELFTDYERCILSFKNNSPVPLMVFADKEQLSRVFINLIKNAIQAIPENTVGRINIRLEKKGEIALISIKDNGKGIAEEIRGKLFQPNFTTKSSGMGLGLAIVRSMVQNAGGSVYFETEYGKGSTFFVEIPLTNKLN